jgi:hypothetical protein
MTDKILIDRAVVEYALDALEGNLPFIEDYGDKEQLSRQHKAIASLYDALRQTIEQAEKHEPVAWVKIQQGEITHSEMSDGSGCDFDLVGAGFVPLYPHPPAAPKQEPVAVPMFRTMYSAVWYEGYADESDGGGPYEERVLYTTPPRREWVGLTDEEIRLIVRKSVESVTVSESVLFRAVAHAIEAALKERNT